VVVDLESLVCAADRSASLKPSVFVSDVRHQLATATFSSGRYRLRSRSRLINLHRVERFFGIWTAGIIARLKGNQENSVLGGRNYSYASEISARGEFDTRAVLPRIWNRLLTIHVSLPPR